MSCVGDPKPVSDPILYTARVTKVLIVNATIMVCHVMVVLLVYATMQKGVHYGSHSNYMP